jgi:hypothetical protein
MSPARQVAVYLAVSMLLFYAIVIFLYGVLTVGGSFIAEFMALFGAVIGMLLSVPVYSRIYIRLFKSGYIEALINKKLYAISQILLFALLVTIWIVLVSNYQHLSSSRFWGDGSGLLPYEIFKRLCDIAFIMIVPFMLVISPLSFVIHGRSFASTWFFFLCIIFSIPLVTIPILWIPMILYYPLLIKFTSRERNNLSYLDIWDQCK